MKVSEIGEFGLIARLAKWRKNPKIKMRLHFNNCWSVSATMPRLTSRTMKSSWPPSDSLVQDVHFSLSYMSWQELGWKSIAVNLSDIAAMGGFPRYALVSLGLPPDTEVENVIDLYRGMFDIAGKFGLAIVGGDTVSSPFVLSASQLSAAPGKRKGACCGVRRPDRAIKSPSLTRWELRRAGWKCCKKD